MITDEKDHRSNWSDIKYLGHAVQRIRTARRGLWWDDPFADMPSLERESSGDGSVNRPRAYPPSRFAIWQFPGGDRAESDVRLACYDNLLAAMDREIEEKLMARKTLSVYRCDPITKERWMAIQVIEDVARIGGHFFATPGVDERIRKALMDLHHVHQGRDVLQTLIAFHWIGLLGYHWDHSPQVRTTAKILFEGSDLERPFNQDGFGGGWNTFLMGADISYTGLLEMFCTVFVQRHWPVRGQTIAVRIQQERVDYKEHVEAIKRIIPGWERYGDVDFVALFREVRAAVAFTGPLSLPEKAFVLYRLLLCIGDNRRHVKSVSIEVVQ